MIIITDKRSNFVSQVMKEVTEFHRITPQQATTKHAEAIGIYERKEALFKKARKNETGERRSRWHKYNNIALLNYYKSYQTSIVCEINRMFRTHFVKCLGLEKGIRQQKQPCQIHKLPKMSLKKEKSFYKKFAKMPCKPKSRTKRNTRQPQWIQN